MSELTHNRANLNSNAYTDIIAEENVSLWYPRNNKEGVPLLQRTLDDLKKFLGKNSDSYREVNDPVEEEEETVEEKAVSSSDSDKGKLRCFSDGRFV